MAPPSKRTSTSRSLLVLKVSPSKLREIFPDERVKQESIEDSTTPAETKESPSASASASNAPANSNPEEAPASDSNAATPTATPAAEGTPSVMAPPDGTKKKGVKRSAATANVTADGLPKPRGKPGPKKKPRLEDGTIDHAAVRLAAAHKAGPRANQGAINAGLRALDRSGKPCRKWSKGGFTLKTFTGVVWEIPRWTAPPIKLTDEEDESGANSANGSNKENKDEVDKEGNSASASNIGGDVEMQSVASIHASSPAPIAVAAAT